MSDKNNNNKSQFTLDTEGTGWKASVRRGVLGSIDVITGNIFDVDKRGSGEGFYWQWDHNKEIKKDKKIEYDNASEKVKNKVQIADTFQKVKNFNETGDVNSTALPKERLKRTYKSRGGLLRYPFEALTEKTDYLQIDIVEYEPSRKSEYNENNLLSRPGTRRIPSRSRVPGGLSTRSLVNKGTVLLQIPSQVQDSNAVNYGDSELNSLQGGLLQAGIDVPTAAGAKLAENPLNLVGGFQAGGDAAAKAFDSVGLTVGGAKSLITKKLATSMVGALGGNVSVNQLLARSEGQILNPNMELLFNGPTIRNFRFSFKMTPRSREEAEQCKLIIRTFKMNMAPKVTSGRGKQSLFLNTPNVFQLRYKTGYRNHPFLHKFKQCFLTDISVNYTGEGVYATYENREPVSMIMDLSFKELEPIYDQDYFNDRGRDADSTVGF